MLKETIAEIHEEMLDGDMGRKALEAFVKDSFVKIAKNGKPFMTATLQDKTGTISLTHFSVTDEISNLFSPGSIVSITEACSNFYDGAYNLKGDDATKYEKLPDTEKYRFVQTVIPDPSKLIEKLTGFVKGIGNDNLRNCCLSLMSENSFKERFYEWPAAQSMHHAEKYGLLFHTTRMMEAGIALCSVYTSADKDLVVAGILFHDYGKIFEIKPSGSYTGIYTPDALLGHIYMGAAKVQEFYLEGRLTEDEYLQLAHIVLSHHGKTEWGSPVTPRTAEARIVHAIDSLDADFYKIENAVMTTPEGELCATASRDGAYYHPHPLSGKKGG